MKRHPPPPHTCSEVECVDDIKFLGVTVSKQLTWSSNTSQLVKKAQQRLFFIQEAETGPAPTETVNFYRIPSRMSWPTVQLCGLPTAQLPNAKSCTVWLKQTSLSLRRRVIHWTLFMLQGWRKNPKASVRTVYSTTLPIQTSAFRQMVKSTTNRLRNGFYPRAVTSYFALFVSTDFRRKPFTF